MLERILRSLALVIAGLAAVDPSMLLRRRQPLSIEIHVGSTELAARVRDRLLRELGDTIALVRDGRGNAVVAIDSDVDVDAIRDGVPVSFVTLHEERNIRLLRASFSGALFPGERAEANVEVAVNGLSGIMSRLAVLQDGVEIGRTEHRWTTARQQRVGVPFVALTTGAHRVQVVATPVSGEQRTDDNVLDAALTVSDRPLNVAFLEYRPTWAARFVREVLETDPRIRVSSLTRVARGIDIRSGNPPSLRASALHSFEVLAVGAPEELRASEVSELREFMAERGGSVLLLPDRRPSGLFTKLIPAAAFDEVLLGLPVRLTVAPRLGVPRGSEFAVPRAPAASIRSLARLADGRPVVASWPIGAGTLIVCGALDAWRYRASDGQQLASFWRAIVTGAGRNATPALSVQVDPAVASRGTRIRVTVRVRRTEFKDDGGKTASPAIAATAQPDGGSESELIRLWPTSEPGVFTGEFVVSEPRKYTVLVNTERAQAAAVLLPADQRSQSALEDEAATIAAASGGVVTTSERLTPLVNHLRALPRDEESVALHPMRSPWWSAPFTIALCAEWMLRRRRGQR
jgi:hypothetical protein